jgi:hypothetical protein
MRSIISSFRRLEACQVLHTSDERDVVDRLGDEVVGTRFEPLHLVGGLIERRDHHEPARASSWGSP